MKTMRYQASLARHGVVLDSVIDDREEVVIARPGHEPSSWSHSRTTSLYARLST